MSRRANIMLVLAAFLLLVGVFVVKNHMVVESPPVAAPAPPLTKVLVMQHDVPAGSFVHANNDLAWQPWPESALQPSYIKEGGEPITSYDGAVARRGLKTGEPVTADILIKPGSGGFLSAVLEPGKRAVSLPVTLTNAASGFIFPGDRVDLIVTHKVSLKQSEQDQDQAVISETFMHDLRVVAVDQQLDNPENKVILAKTVTVEVTPKQAERVAVAQEIGSISLVLRSLATAPKPTDATGAAPSDPLMSALEATGTNESGFTQGSDVSDALNRHGSAMPHMLIIHGETREQRSFYGAGQ